MTTYPSKDKIEEIFSDRDLPDTFNSYLAEQVDVSVAGQNFTASGLHKSKDAYHEAVYTRIAAVLKLETIRLEVHHVIGGGDSAWAAVHSTGTGLSQSDKPFKNEFVDLVRFNTEGKIVQLKEFFDTKEVHDHLAEHETSQTKEKETEGS